MAPPDHASRPPLPGYCPSLSVWLLPISVWLLPISVWAAAHLCLATAHLCLGYCPSLFGYCPSLFGLLPISVRATAHLCLGYCPSLFGLLPISVWATAHLCLATAHLCLGYCPSLFGAPRDAWPSRQRKLGQGCETHTLEKCCSLLVRLDRGHGKAAAHLRHGCIDHLALLPPCSFDRMQFRASPLSRRRRLGDVCALTFQLRLGLIPRTDHRLERLWHGAAGTATRRAGRSAACARLGARILVLVAAVSALLGAAAFSRA
eukprot:scaffold10267_cov116-Isochrysis_galbana.AAC.9